MSKSGEITKEILLLLLRLGGALSLTAILVTVPGLAIGLAPFLKKEKPAKSRLVKSLEHLKREKYVRVREQDDQTVIELTERGRSRALVYRVEDLKIKAQERWDGRWRLVIFDIPVERKLGRDSLRWRLKKMGFFQLQESVWIHPYPCREEVEFLARVYEVWSFVKIMTVSELSSDDAEKLGCVFHLMSTRR